MLWNDNMHALPDKNGRRDLGDTTFDSASRRPASAALAAVFPIHGVCTRQMYSTTSLWLAVRLEI